MRAPEFWQHPGALPNLLQPLAAAYGTLGRVHRGWVKPAKVSVPVICVGNLVAGGAGKTPTVLAVVAALRGRGCQPHMLLRGYGGRHKGPLRVEPGRHDATLVGDEALLLTRAAPTWIAANRPAGARQAVAAGAEAIVMDDGFQNPSLSKDLSLIVVDGSYGFGNERLLPAGPLREGVAEGLARAQALVVLGSDGRGLAARFRSRLPVLPGQLVAAANAPSLQGQRVLAFAGIGNPSKFFDSLHAAGAELAEVRALPDHHPYGAAELHDLCARAESLGALPITTEKDAARLPQDMREKIAVFPVTLVWQDPQQLATLLDRVFADG